MEEARVGWKLRDPAKSAVRIGVNRIGVEAHAHARPLRINTASTRRGRNRVRSGRTINRSLTNKVRYLGTRRPRVTKEKRQIKWITCIITMRAFIAHRQTFVIWGCIYLWDSNPFLLYRSLRATDPDPTVVRVKLFFLLYYELLSVSFLPFLPSYRFFKITFFLQFLRSMKLKNKNIMISTYQRSFL